MVRLKLRIALLALGTVVGYGSAAFHCAHARHARHQAFEQHVARVCVDAARGNTHGPESAPRW